MAKKLDKLPIADLFSAATATPIAPKVVTAKDEIDIVDELHEDFLVYADEVNTNRAFPDVRDGLKISQRAVLWQMFNKGYFSTKPHVKSAKVDGGVIANWHPHGSEYLTLVRMSQSWVNNIPEIDFHGGNGSLLGGADAAASRYTECRLDKASEKGFFLAIKKNTVDMVPNFSEDEEWPAVFPAIFPRLFVNGSQGIGYTIAQEWEPGNLAEFYEKVKEFIKSGKITYDNIYPDYPTGGVIINKSAISEIYRTGRGQVVLRGKAEILGDFIQITELPYQIYAEPLIQKIKDLVNAGTLTGIEDICNKSDDNGLLIEIECDNDPKAVLAQLYKLTDLQTSFNANQMALLDGIPQMFTLADYIKTYVEHNITCIKREYTWELDKASARKQIVDGLIQAIQNIDQVIALIKQSATSAEAEKALITNLQFTANQAKAIVDMRLGKLANLQLSNLQAELIDLEETINVCNTLLGNPAVQNKEFLSRLKAFVSQFGYERRTEVIDIDLLAEKAEVKSKVQKTPDKWVIVLTKARTIKRVAASNYKQLKKPTVDSDIQLSSKVVEDKQRVVLISVRGTMYKLPIQKIPSCTSAAAGTPLKDFFKEPIIALYREDDYESYKYMFMLTKCGLAKKIESETVLTLSKLAGAPIMKVDEQDQIIYCKLVNSEEIVVKYNKKQKKLNTDDFLAKGRSAGGVRAVKVKQGQCISL